MALHLVDKVEASLRELERFGIIAKSDEPTPFLSNLLVTQRKDKSQLRLLLDCRLINAYSYKIATSLPSIESIMSKFHDAKYITTLDLSNSFFSIGIKKEHRKFFSFNSPKNQRYVFQRLPNGKRLA